MDATGIPAPLPRVMIESEQVFVDKRVQKLNHEEGIAGGFVMHELSQRRDALRFAVKRRCDQVRDVHPGEGRQRDLIDRDASVPDGLKLARQWMRGIDLVVAVRADQHEVSQIRVRQKVFKQIERRRVEPLQIVEKKRKRMFSAGKHADETPEHQYETMLRLLWRKLHDGRRVTDDELQFGNEVGHELRVAVQRFE